MAEKRRLLRLKDSLMVAVPPMLQQVLGLRRGQEVWWHLPWKGEAVMTATPTRSDGYPEALTLLDELVAARGELVRLRRRNEARDHALYAEGYAAGRLDAAALLSDPTGPRAMGLMLRARWQEAWVAGGFKEDRRGKRRAARAREARDPLSGEVVPAILSEGQQSP